MSEFKSLDSENININTDNESPISSIENYDSSSLIRIACIQIHTDTDASLQIPKDVLYNQEYHFGILDIETANTPCIREPQIIIFSIDISASMSDLCKDNRTQMQHAIHTAKNVITAISKIEDANVSIIVYAFDDYVEKIINLTKITSDNVSNLHTMLENCKPRGSTNIEKALQNAVNVISSLKTTEPLSHISHIFLTDGQATVGEYNSEVLYRYVDSSIRNIFIGYGVNHSYTLLNLLASHKNGSYVFVDDIENTGIVFGDIVYGILYKSIVDIRFEAENCELYNFVKDTWDTQLELPYLLSESKKTYHVRTKTPAIMNVKIYGKNALFDASPETKDVFEDVGGVMPDLQDSLTNLDKYMFRQRTLELIFKSKEIRTKTSFVGEIKKELILFLKIMQEYMNQHDLKTDTFYQTLCDDIKITSKTIDAGGNTFDMYSTARQHSQGRQGSYNVSLPPNQNQPGRNFNTGGVVRRQNCNVSTYYDNEMDEQETYKDDCEPDDCDYDLDQENQTQTYETITPTPVNRTYTSERQRTLMSDISQS